MTASGGYDFAMIDAAEKSGAVPGVLGAFYRTGEIPNALPDPIMINPWTQVAGGKVLMTIPGIARYMMEGGNSIIVQGETGADWNSVALFLNGPARAYLIHQRGEVPLEAATVVSPRGSAVALTSTSGIGKSTLASALCLRGWQLAADSITRVTVTAGRVLAWPSDDHVSLWRSACVSFGIDADAHMPIRPGMEKFRVPMPASRGPVPLRAIVRLIRGEIVVRMDSVRQTELIKTIQQCQFRWSQIEPLLPPDELNPVVVRMAETCQVSRLSGARECPPSELADMVARTVQ